MCSVARKLSCVDVIYLLCILGSALSAGALASEVNSANGGGDQGQSALAVVAWVFDFLQALGIFNRVVYSTVLLSSPERTDRVTQLMLFNLGAITGISAAVTVANIVILSIVLTDGLKLAALVFNVIFLFFEKYYGRRFLKKHQRNIVHEGEALPLRHKRVLSYNTLAANWLPLSWFLYLISFIPLYCFI